MYEQRYLPRGKSHAVPFGAHPVMARTASDQPLSRPSRNQRLSAMTTKCPQGVTSEAQDTNAGSALWEETPTSSRPSHRNLSDHSWGYKIFAGLTPDGRHATEAELF
jgi:hypothetical protein